MALPPSRPLRSAGCRTTTRHAPRRGCRRRPSPCHARREASESGGAGTGSGAAASGAGSGMVKLDGCSVEVMSVCATGKVTGKASASDEAAYGKDEAAQSTGPSLSHRISTAARRGLHSRSKLSGGGGGGGNEDSSCSAQQPASPLLMRGASSAGVATTPAEQLQQPPAPPESPSPVVQVRTSGLRYLAVSFGSQQEGDGQKEGGSDEEEEAKVSDEVKI